MARTHGKRSTYRLGCRCDACRTAQREALQRFRRRREAPEAPISPAQLRQSFVHRDRLGYSRRSTRERWLEAVGALVGREIDSTKDLSEVEAAGLMVALRASRDADELEERVLAARTTGGAPSAAREPPAEEPRQPSAGRRAAASSSSCWSCRCGARLRRPRRESAIVVGLVLSCPVCMTESCLDLRSQPVAARRA